MERIKIKLSKSVIVQWKNKIKCIYCKTVNAIAFAFAFAFSSLYSLKSIFLSLGISMKSISGIDNVACFSFSLFHSLTHSHFIFAMFSLSHFIDIFSLSSNTPISNARERENIRPEAHITGTCIYISWYVCVCVCTYVLFFQIDSTNDRYMYML